MASRKDAGQDKPKALEMALSQIEKDFGKGAIMKMGDVAGDLTLSAIPTGALAIDIALGIGGIPKGRIIELYGPESSGKTTLALHIVAEAQKMGGIATYIDAEHALDPEYAEKIGVDIDEMYLSQPDTGEQALNIVDMLVRSNAVDIIVVDSVAALVPRAEIEGNTGDTHIGLQARLMSQAMRKLTGIIAKSKTAVIFINQIRMKIGVMFGNPETTPGGRALKFYSSVRIDVRRIGQIKDGQEVIGTQCVAKIVKNKVAPPFKKAPFDIMFDSGISAEGSIIDLAVDHKIIAKSGAWFSYDGDHIGQGRENAKAFLKEHTDICETIRGKVLEAVGLAPSKPEEPAEA